MDASEFERLADAGYAAWKRDLPPAIGVDTETHGVAFFDRAFCGTVYWEVEGVKSGHYFELEHFDSRPYLREILAETGQWKFHNPKFDLQKFLLEGVLDREAITTDRFDDTEAQAHLLDEHQVKRLKVLAVKYLQIDDTIDVPITSGPNKGKMRKVNKEKHELDSVRRKLKLKVEDGYGVLPRDVVIPYAIMDSEFTYRLDQVLLPEVESKSDLRELYHMEKELTLVLLDMEARGMALDTDYVDGLVREYNALYLEAQNVVEQIVQKPVGKDKDAGEFNPNSSDQIAETFTDLGFVSKSYDKKYLATVDHPLAAAILELRRVGKLRSTYIFPMREEQRDGIIHPSFRQHGTVTGRMSSGEDRNN